MIVYYTGYGQAQYRREDFVRRFPGVTMALHKEEADVVIEMSDDSYSPRQGQLLVRLMRDDRPAKPVSGDAILCIKFDSSWIATLARFGLHFGNAMRR